MKDSRIFKLGWLLILLLFFTSCKKQNLHTVSYSSECLSGGFEFRYLGTNGDTNTVFIKGKQIEVNPMVFETGQKAWCGVKSTTLQMGEVKIIVDNSIKNSFGVCNNLQINQVVK